MKKYIPLLINFFILFACDAWAAHTVTLTTVYPAPTSAYNQVNLSPSSPNYSTPNYSSANPFCTGANNGTYFYDTSNALSLSQCVGLWQATLYCANAANNGMIFVDSKGTLHVCNNGASSVYPQECYNIFCTYDKSQYTLASSNCNPYQSVTHNLVCPSGFMQTAINTAAPLYYDTFQTSTNTVVVYAACCTQ